ncbi:MAG: hypothetical protein NXH87_09470 [Rhodobiaceae bacterium]|nr:hypothetical protein [Rhodobiaceae bacterium]
MSDNETATVMQQKSCSMRTTWALGVCLTSLLILSSCGEDRPETNTLGLNAPSDTSLITGSVQGLQRRGVFIQLPAGLPDELASQLLARFQEASIANQLTLARTGTVPEYTVKGVVRAGASRNGTAVVVVWEVIGPDGKRVKRMTDDVVIQRRNSADPAFYDPWAVVDEATLEEIADTAALELAGWVSDQTLGASPDSDVSLTTASIEDTEPTEAQNTQVAGTTPSVDLSTPSLLQARQPNNSPPDLSGIAARNATLGIASPVTAPPPQAAQTQSPPRHESEEVVSPAAALERATLPPQPSQEPRSNSNGTRALFDVAVGTSPGDGRLSLAAAVQEALVKADHKAERQQAFRVIGNVALEPVRGGTTPGIISVNIEWTVTTKEGTPLGLITQSNQVDEAALAGAWGSIATAAGAAAADGILQLINEPTPPA